MCGITGIVDLEGLSPADGDALDSMIESLRHRGPDAQSRWQDDRAALGHARLSIIDVGGGRQPMSNEDDSIWIVFNGEIYNFPELRPRLESKGHVFKTNSDTEAIIHLYEEEGERCVEHLRGMFAFALWDQRRGTLLLARDHLGIKPLYYARTGNRVVFGSETKALLAAPGVGRDVDIHALQDYLTYLWVPGPRSIFRGMEKLPAGHTAVLNDRGLRLREFWNLEFSESAGGSEKDLEQRFIDVLSDSVQSQMIADVPLGAFLSGGLDSSTVVALMTRASDRPVVAHSIGFAEDAFNELAYADIVAQRFHCVHHRQVIEPNALALVDLLGWHFDEPFADASAIPTYEVAKMAREHVTVALSGDGGDESMAGYRRHSLHHFERLVRHSIPRWLRQGVLAPLAWAYPKADWLPRPLRAKSTLENLAGDDLRALYQTAACLDPRFCRDLLLPDVRRQLADYDSIEPMASHYEKSKGFDPLSRELYLGYKTSLVDDMLTKVDRASMAVSLEVRVPLLDHHYVEFVATIPSGLKMHRGEGKWLFKNAARPILGKDVVDRPKMGFDVPLKAWFRGPLKERTEDALLASDARIGQWIDLSKVRWLWRQHQLGLRNMEQIIFALLMLEQWARNFATGSIPNPPRQVVAA